MTYIGYALFFGQTFKITLMIRPKNNKGMFQVTWSEKLGSVGRISFLKHEIYRGDFPGLFRALSK